jgi:hypothetical protein
MAGIPRANLRQVAGRPSLRGAFATKQFIVAAAGIEVIWGSGEQNYFCKRVSTDPFSGSPSGKSLPMKPLAPAGARALIGALIVEQIN